MDKFYLSKIDENGRLVLPEELAQNIHSGLVDIEVEDGRIIIKPSEPDYILTWTPEKKK